jgi:hypothetical protein
MADGRDEELTARSSASSPALRAQDALPHRTTVVFAFDTPEEHAELMAYVKPRFLLDSGLRISGLAVDNEMLRVRLIEEALERFDDGYDLRDAIEEIIGCLDLSKFSWNHPLPFPTPEAPESKEGE